MNRLHEQAISAARGERAPREGAGPAPGPAREHAGREPALLLALHRDRAAELEPRQPLRGELPPPRHPRPQGSDRHHPGDHRQPDRLRGGRPLRARPGEADPRARGLLRARPRRRVRSVRAGQRAHRPGRADGRDLRGRAGRTAAARRRSRTVSRPASPSTSTARSPARSRSSGCCRRRPASRTWTASCSTSWPPTPPPPSTARRCTRGSWPKASRGEPRRRRAGGPRRTSGRGTGYARCSPRPRASTWPRAVSTPRPRPCR